VRLLFLFLFLTLMLLSRTELYPVESCLAYDDLKHTKNSGDIRLDPKRSYEVRRHYKGQYLIIVKDKKPFIRWVDENCFAPKSALYVAPAACEVRSIGSEKSTTINKKRGISQENILALSWHNAFCETHRRRKECSTSWHLFPFANKYKQHFTLHGVWPQPKNRVYCGVERRYIAIDRHREWHKLPEPKLTSETKKRLDGIMPGTVSNLHRHEWIKHGTCYGTDAEHYFKDAIAMTEEVRYSKVGTFFQKHIGKRVTLKQVRAIFDESFGKGAGERVEMKCKNGLITELWLHIGGGSGKLKRLLHQGKRVVSRCRRGIVDKAGYGR